MKKKRDKFYKLYKCMIEWKSSATVKNKKLSKQLTTVY